MVKILLLIFAVSIDGFAAAIGLGSAGIKVPVRSAAIISLIGTAFLGLSVGLADFFVDIIPFELCRIISSALLIALGLFNLFHGTLRRISLKHTKHKNKQPTPLAMLFDETAADTDNSKTISCREALVFSIALSADSIIIGVSAGLNQIMLIPLIILAFGVGLAAIIGGVMIGKKLALTGKLNLQWLCGIMLILLAVLR